MDKARIEKSIDYYIKQELSFINFDEVIDSFYLDFYQEVKYLPLKQLFQYLHQELNLSFEDLNSRLKDYYYFHAQDSRDLLFLFDVSEKLSRKTIDSTYGFNVNQHYLEKIEECKTFLKKSGGSSVPEDFKEIKIVENEPIFFLKNSVIIKNDSLTQNSELKLIGEGSYAQVFKYKDKFYDKTFALKRVKKNLNPKELERFKQEFEILSNCNYPYIVEVFNFQNSEYNMEYIDRTLDKFIEQNNTKLKQSDRKSLVNQVFKAFEYLHKKDILHRDISFSNVLVKLYDSELPVIKLSDFGLAKVRDSNLTDTQTEVKGSLNDPKLDIVGFKNYSIKHETFALTRLIYFIMTGRKKIDKFEKQDFKDFIEKGLSDNVEDRYKSVSEIRQAFSSINF